MVELCETAYDLKIEVDPDGIIEDREDVIKEKLDLDGQHLTNPSLLQGYTSDISCVPRVSIIDMYNYFVPFSDYDDATFRDYHRMEGYTLKKDGYVLDLTAAAYPDSNSVCAVRSKVRPRTRDKDPVTKLPYYNVWIILKKDGNRIFSAYCTCKGGYVYMILKYNFDSVKMNVVMHIQCICMTL